jgi:hypothetical protein
MTMQDLTLETLESLREAREGMAEFYAYSEEMRKIGRGYSWAPYPGGSQLSTLARLDAIIAKLESR